nr:uncharacterized mitochondrial protein AtMg00810-like [Tanacetum cinerariifolium]
RARGIFPGTLPLDRVEVLGSVDDVTTSLQLSQNSRPPMLDLQDKNMMKAQVHVSKSFVISDEQPLPRRKHYCQIYQVVKYMLRGRLLASFQDHEHEGGDTRSQGSMQMISQRNSQEQGSKIQERPDIVHATCLCARYQAKPTEKHLKEVKKIFRYLWGTVNTGLWYTKDSGSELTGFSDADYARCKDTFKSTSGGAQFLGEKLVSWSSKKQYCTALSTAEAEYVSLSASIRFQFIVI